MNPWPTSQISSSWRRTLRWLRAKPPGRSDAASRSLMIQQKHAGLRGPAPSGPSRHRVSVPSARSITSSSRDVRRAVARDVVHPHDAAPWSTAHTVGGQRARRRGAATAVAEHACRGSDLRDVPDQHAARRRAPTSSASRASSARLCSAVLPKPMPGSAQQRAARDARPRARPRVAVDEEVADLARRRRRSAGLPASCAARPACASRRARRRPRRRHRACRGRCAAGDVVDDASRRRRARPRRPRPSWCRCSPARRLGGERARRPAARGAAPRRRRPARRRAGSTRRRRRARRRPPRPASRPCATAASGSRKRPPSEKESGVTLTMPMTAGRAPQTDRPGEHSRGSDTGGSSSPRRARWPDSAVPQTRLARAVPGVAR